MRSRTVPILLLVAFMASVSGCATLKNTKIPGEFGDLGVCPSCRQVVAVEGFSGNEIAVCPECESDFLVKDSKRIFRKRCVDLKNRKTASGVLTAALMAASIAAAIYGIPIPPPPIDEETFRPFEFPVAISARRAAQPPLSEPRLIMESSAAKLPADLKFPMPSPFNDRYSFYESPYSVIIADKFPGDYDCLIEAAPYDISMGRIAGERYEVEYINDAYRPFALRQPGKTWR